MNKNETLYQITWLSRPLMQRAEALVEKNLKNTGLSVRMRAVLEVLQTHGQKTVPELALLLQIQRQYVQVMVNEVIKDNYAEKHSNPRHRSSPLIALTAKGAETIQAVRDKEKQLINKISQCFDPEEVSITLRVIETLLDQLNQESKNGSS